VASKIKYLYFSGGAVPSASGNIVSKKLPLHQVIGSSECAMFPLIREERESNSVDWSYIQVHPASNVEFRHRFGDFYELVIVRKPENEHFQPIFTHFPDLQEYETRDLFSPHPIKPGFWKHRSRIDDIIVFLNGEKTNPVSFEHEVSRHPEIKSALVAGNQRVEASLLVELLRDDIVSSEEQGEIIERIWPTVHAANTQCPAYARVSKSRILFADPAVPFLRAPKGTVQRQATIDLYEDKLNKLYLETSSEDSENAFRNLEISEGKSTIDVIRDLMKRVTEWEILNDGDDIFSLGMDSLQVIQLRRGLISALGISTISTGFIYENPSVDLLTKAITITPNEQNSIASAHRGRIVNIKDTLKKFEDEIDNIAVPKTIRASSKDISPPGKEVVLLTGSTGAVGSFLLDKLVQNISISKVYCLNRLENSETIQMARNKARGLSTEIPSSRVVFLTADLAKPNFGLDEKVFNNLAATTTRIIHNAWTVDFNKTLQSFQSNISGLLGLISFSAASDLSPSLFFISSISSVGNYHNTKESLNSIPETILHDPETPSPMGYGESKYIAERLLDYAEQKFHITTGAARVGQIAGTAENPRGWNRQEWFPSLVLSSKFLGALPETLGFGGNDAEGIDWVPIDQLVDVLIELAIGLGNKAGDPGMRVFHPIHPAPTSWKSLLPIVRESLTSEDGSQIEVVSFLEWVKRLRGTSELGEEDLGGKKHEEMIHKNPGVKLLDFYEGLLLEDGLSKSLKMETKETLESSSLLRELKPIQKEWLQGWIKGWTA
jgi:thioester reductase-like protein